MFLPSSGKCRAKCAPLLHRFYPIRCKYRLLCKNTPSSSATTRPVKNVYVGQLPLKERHNKISALVRGRSNSSAQWRVFSSAVNVHNQTRDKRRQSMTFHETCYCALRYVAHLRCCVISIPMCLGRYFVPAFSGKLCRHSLFQSCGEQFFPSFQRICLFVESPFHFCVFI